MRRRELSEEELTQVINLKRAGSSWVKIQGETGINRRTAKHAYDKWERSQSLQELKEARKDVAAKAFLDHLKSLTTLAGSLVTNLSVPSSPDMMTKNAEQFFAWLWHQNLLWRGVYTSAETQERYNLSQINVYTMGDPQCFLRGDPQFNSLENQLLFKSLQDHTRGEEVRWQALDEWRKARDNCVKVLGKLRKEPRVLVKNFLNLERQSNLLDRIKEESKEDDPVKQMAEAVLKGIWQCILEDRLDQESPLVQAVSRRLEIVVKVGDKKLFTFTDKSLAEKVTHICNLVADSLCKGEKSRMVESLQKDVREMKKASEELRETLNPVKLTPMILRTRCDLCPA